MLFSFWMTEAQEVRLTSTQFIHANTPLAKIKINCMTQNEINELEKNPPPPFLIHCITKSYDKNLWLKTESEGFKG